MSSFSNPSPSTGIWSIERVVALLTPVFAAAAGWLTTVLGTAIPGVTIPPDQIIALFVAGATAAAAAALKWLHGRSKFTTFESDAGKVIHGVVGEIQKIAPPFVLADIESVLQGHTAQIIDALGHTIHAPASAEEIAKTLVQELWPSRATPAVGATVHPVQ